MKRILAAVLAIMMIVGCTLTMASCSALSIFDPKPETDLEKAQENLEDKDYVVKVVESTKENDLGVGIDSILYAYDLKPLIEAKEAAAEALDETFDFEGWKNDQGEDYVEVVIAELAELGENWSLKITVYEDKKLAGFACDRLELADKMADEYEKAAEKDAKKHGESYNQDKVEEKYDEKSDKISYERAKYLLKEYDRDLTAEEKLMYEEIVRAYEEDEDDWFYGQKGTAVWEGTKQAIKDSK